jgi:hypothetical protein
MLPKMQIRLPVVVNKLPVRLKKYPDPSRREFVKITAQYQLFTGALKVQYSTFSQKYPDNSLLIRDIARDWFAQDCPHRHDLSH